MNHSHNGNRTVLRRLFAKRLGRRRIDAPAGFLSAEEFNAQLELERARVDRSGHAFTVIVFEIHGTIAESDAGHAQQALIRALIERTRRCDTKGWYRHRPAVILPYTSKSSVMHVTAPIEEIFHRLILADDRPLAPKPRLAFAAYGYPHDPLPVVNAPGSREAEPLHLPE